MSDLVKRLRRLCKSKYLPADKDLVFMLYKECADEIERLEKERDELKARMEGTEKTDNVHIRLSSSSREPWLCPRCGKVHGPNSYWCDCPPDFIKI